ncbi:hypothetical protein LTR61_011428 [Exophiala xenobiotica]|nr:hypothetical protein LTR61_011428 [Exophiala xenobiotica]
MSLQFLDICQLFEQLSSLRDLESRELSVQQWFGQHQSHIRRRGAPALALLSCLFPEKRADRVYALRTQQLEHMVTKAACLGHTRVSELRRLQGRDRMGFASAVQQVLSATDDFSNPPQPLTVDEVDHTLDRLASTCVFSSPKLRESITFGYTEVFDELVRVLRRLPSVGVKWMIRLLLKSLCPVEIPVTRTLRAFHFLMPDLLKVRTSLSGAVQLLEGDTISQLPVSPPPSLERSLKESARAEIEPRLGMMIGLQGFEKARSIQHCCQLAGHKEINVERKYDGEYCQIHVSRTNSQHHITIFSKSGRDSTMDRVGVHDAIKRCLGLAVVEVVGAGFDRPPNERFFTLRFPRIQKIHHDRTYADSLDFDEYQRLAKQSVVYLKERDHQNNKGRLPAELAILEPTQPTSCLAPSDISRGVLYGLDSETNTELVSRNNLIAHGSTLRALTQKRKRSVGSGLTSSVPQKMRKTTVAEEPNKDRNTISSPSAAPAALHLARGQYMRDCGTPTPHDQSNSGPRDDPSRAVVPEIPVPLLCDTSLWDLFHDPTVDVAAACWKSPLEITSRKEVFLDGVTGRMTNKAGWRGHALIPHIVLVNWSSTSDVLNGIQSWLSVLQGHESLLSRPGSWEITFLNWNALEAFGHPSQDTSHSVDSFSHGSIVCKD